MTILEQQIKHLQETKHLQGGKTNNNTDLLHPNYEKSILP